MSGARRGRQQPLQAGDPCLVNVGESRYFNSSGKTRWVDATVDRVAVDGNKRRYDVTVTGTGQKLYGENPVDVKKTGREAEAS